MFIVVLRAGSGNDVYLRPDRTLSIDVYLRTGSGNDIYLRREGRPAAGVVEAPPSEATGTIAWTEASDTWAVTGVLTASASINWTEADDTWAITGTVTAGTNEGAIAWTEADDVWSITGTVADAETVRPSGGWPFRYRTRTRKEIHDERVRLGILPAIVEESQDIQAEERAAFAFYETIPSASLADIAIEKRSAALRLPLFEFSGACAGCGETQKMITVMITGIQRRNATGPISASARVIIAPYLRF